ncbi:MAG: histidinol-phosphate transaminase [Pseudomonadota bacterium]|nr:histidinol-phosphate transaminase [Pseudomonadota bacterium]
MPLDYRALAVSSVCDLLPYEPGKPPDELEREYGVRNAIKLASNENPSGPSDSVKKAIETAAKNINRYPDGSGFYLRKALANKYGVSPDQITLGNGSNDILVMLAECFLAAGTSAIYDEYSFIIYRTAVKATGAEARQSASINDKNAQYLGHDLHAMSELIDSSTRLVFIANPNNPTGTWVSNAQLHDFLLSVPDHVLVVLDEAYYEYALGEDYENTIPWLEDFENLIILRTFSKAYGLAGLRVGYSISSKSLAELLNRVRQPFNVNHIAQAAALAALGDEDWVSESQDLNLRSMALLKKGLDKLKIPYIPSKANFLLVELGKLSDDCYEYLLKHGLIVRPVKNYGLQYHLRISIGAPAEMIVLLTNLADFQAAHND